MSNENEQLKQQLNTEGTKLFDSIISLLKMKSFSNRFPFEPSTDTLSVSIKGRRVSLEGKNDTRVYSYLVLDSEDSVTLYSSNLADKKLSGIRSKEIIEGVKGIRQLFSVYDVTAFNIYLESDGSKVSMVADTSQGRVSI